MTTLDLLEKELESRKDKKVVLVGGCFDLLHIGHLRYLEKAKKLGDILVAGINGDEFIKKTKGKSRPIIPEAQRAEMLMGLRAVDYVFITDTALYDDKNLEKINPAFFVFSTEKDKIVRRKLIAKNIEQNYPQIKTVFLSSGIGHVRTSSIEKKIIKSDN